MHLLQANDDGRFSLTEFVGQSVPRYAILPHTWGADHEEVTYQDLLTGIGKEKPGYQKLRFCANQAKQDNVGFFWVDTCCINKSSSAELSEAINSMLRWYSDATVCYVYLTDVSIEKFESSLSASRWFTRSWTLQELIAPKAVVLFAAEGVRIGDKSSLCQQLHEITGIPVRALHGEALGNFSIAERMHWATNRCTQRPEDAVYCLLGFLDISMPVIYGEGRERAMKRLHRELRFAIGDMSLYGASLYEAVRRAEFTSVDLLLQAGVGVSINYVNPMEPQESILHAAVRSNSSKILESVLAAKPWPDPYSGDGLTPLMLAAILGNDFAVTMLLDAGCALEIQLQLLRKQYTMKIDMEPGRITHGSTAPLLAAQNGRYKVAKLLLDFGAQINATTNLNFTPLVATAYYGHLDCVKLLLENKPGLEAKTDGNWTALIYSAYRGHIQIASVLLDAGANIEAKKSGGYDSLARSCMEEEN